MTTSKREHIFVPGFIVVNKFEVSQYIYQGNNLVYTLFWLKNSKISQHTSHQIKNNKLTQKKTSKYSATLYASIIIRWIRRNSNSKSKLVILAFLWRSMGCLVSKCCRCSGRLLNGCVRKISHTVNFALLTIEYAEKEKILFRFFFNGLFLF